MKVGRDGALIGEVAVPLAGVAFQALVAFQAVVVLQSEVAALRGVAALRVGVVPQGVTALRLVAAGAQMLAAPVVRGPAVVVVLGGYPPGQGLAVGLRAACWAATVGWGW